MTSRDRRALVWGGMVVVAAVLLLRALPAGLHAAGRLRGRALEQRTTAARARAVLAAAPAVHDSLARVLAAIVALAPQLVGGDASAEAQATLAGLVNAAAASHGLKVLGLDPLPDSTVGVFVRVALHAVLEGDSRGLAGFLQALETGNPVLTIPALDVSAPDPVGRAGAPEVLHLEVEVSGYYLPRGP